MNELKQILSLPAFIYEGVKYYLGGTLFTPKPRMVQFPVCDRCNARCIMCNRWQKDTVKEISVDKIREVFNNNMFSEVEDVCLHGGEPTLREDLAEICKIIQDSCPDIKRMWISTNGFGATRIRKRMEEILHVMNFNKIRTLDINVSVDGIEETHDKIRGIKGGFRQCIETIKMLKRLSEDHPVTITMGTVIQPLNLYQIDKIEELAANLNIPIVFQPLMFDKFFSIRGDSHLQFSKDDVREFKKIIENKLTGGSSTTNFYWCDFLSMMKGGKRRSPCAFDRYVFSLYPTGEVLPCSREEWIIYGNVYDQPADKIWYSRKAKDINKRMRKEICPTCSFYCSVEFALQKEFFKYLKFYVKKKIFHQALLF